MEYNSLISAQLVIPASFAECFTYEKQILWLKNEIDSLSGDPDAIAELQRKVETLERNYKKLQTQVNNLPIDVIENEMAVISADIQLIKNTLDTKQDVLTWDNEPTAGSQNPVRSEGILEAIHNEGMRVEQLINGKVDEETFNEAMRNIINNYVTTGDLTEALTAYAKLSDIADMATKTELANYATKSEIEGLVTNEELAAAIADLATKSELADYATKTDISDMATKTELANYAKTEDLGVYATKTELGEYVKDGELATELTNYATKTELSQKQDTLVWDNTPKLNSTNPVTSDGIKKAIDTIPSVEVDSTVSQSSENPVSSNGIYNFVLDQMGDLVTTEQLATKQDILTFDTFPTSASTNVVTSNGIRVAIDRATKDTVKTSQLAEYATKAEITDMATNTSVDSKLSNYATKDTTYTKEEVDAMYDYLMTLIDMNKQDLLKLRDKVNYKQDSLTFDDMPLENSLNPVTSDGIYKAIEMIRQ